MTIVKILLIITLSLSCFVNGLIMECGFGDHKQYGYSCYATLTDLIDPIITSFNGSHVKGKTHQDVKHFYLQNEKLKFFPQNIHEIFPNLTSLAFDTQKLEKICRIDLHNFGEKLETLIIIQSSIEFIRADLFASTPNIKELEIKSNEIKSIERGAFSGLKNLERLNVDFNCFDDESEDIQDLAARIYEKCYDRKVVDGSSCEGIWVEDNGGIPIRKLLIICIIIPALSIPCLIVILKCIRERLKKTVDSYQEKANDEIQLNELRTNPINTEKPEVNALLQPTDDAQHYSPVEQSARDTRIDMSNKQGLRSAVSSKSSALSSTAAPSKKSKNPKKEN